MLHSKASKLAILAAVCLLGLGASQSAHAREDDITFESFLPGTFDTQTRFYEAGYMIEYTPVDPYGPGVFPYGFAEIGEPPFTIICGPTPCSSDGTNAFYSFNTGSLTISATDGHPISLRALDAAQTFTDLNRILDFTVTGRTKQGISVSQEFVTAPGDGDSFQTFNVAHRGFTNLASVTITGTGGWPTTEFAVDNIVVSGGGVPGGVPEPSTWAMMLAGFAGLGFAGYRRARAGHATLAA